jgi:DNA-binding GntR family transcriptional regulator
MQTAGTSRKLSSPLARESAVLEAREVHDIITKKQYAANWLREMIVSGDLPPGRRVRQQEVADRLGISATPVREAILQLETEGYLESMPHVGVRVAELAADYRDEVTELRKLLEGQLARAAAQRITDEQIEQLKVLRVAFQDAVGRFDARDARRTNYQLHRFVWEVAGRDVTQQIVQGLWARVPWHSLDDVDVRGRQSAIEHEDLVNALIAHDQDEAQRATERHIESSRVYLPRSQNMAAAEA